jgi:hypothetical protein
MSETLTKLRPDRDLQCYFQMPSAVAALSAASETGFTLSGCWRQQFDWAVLEWNRDNVFEHPQLRNLPDGDLSGIVLTYQEQRFNCIPVDSTLSPTVDWPYLRIWADHPDPYKVPLRTYATPVSGSTVPASATFTLSGTLTEGDLIELAWDDEHINYTIGKDETLDSAASRLAYAISQYATMVTATVSGASIILTVKPTTTAYAGANGNRLGAYGMVSGSGGTESWTPAAQQFSGGQSTSIWEFRLPLGALTYDGTGKTVPANDIRLMRWTYAADLQPATYQRSEFSVTFTNWSVTGSGLTYSVSGPGSERIEDTSTALTYSTTPGPNSTIIPDWTLSSGNFSGGSIHSTTTQFATCTYQFVAERAFDVYIGTRRGSNCAVLTASIDGVAAPAVNLSDGLEDSLVRLAAGTVQPGSHTVVVQHTGDPNTCLWLDFMELVVPVQQLPDFSSSPVTTLATDWDTLHSIALAPERTAWLIDRLGFTGRANHYTGALWFYELVRVGHVYATGTIQFGGHPDDNLSNKSTVLSVGFFGSSQGPSLITHYHLSGDTPDTIAKAFELRINSGYTAIWATATGSTLTIQSRLMGTVGNSITIGISTNSTISSFATSPQLTGGVDGAGGGVGDILSVLLPSDSSAAYAVANRGWRTDLAAVPRINRAARDWSRSFFAALKNYGIQATAAFSTELQHGDPSSSAGIAQCYPSGDPVTVTTPALQTNFSPASLAFWQQTYADMAQVMVEAGQIPYLQFGEVQWWYFPYDQWGLPIQSGLPFYDAYTTSQFTAQYGRPMATITDNSVRPVDHPQEAEFLPTLIGAFTRTIQQFVRQSQPTTRFEVLYPCDTNSYPFTAVANLPLSDWTPASLDCLKTENFTFTGDCNLELAKGSIDFPAQLGFPANKASHLVGISGPATPWQQEASTATNAGLDSVVLFALDQYCLIGYQSQSWRSRARSFMIP